VQNPADQFAALLFTRAEVAVQEASVRQLTRALAWLADQQTFDEMLVSATRQACGNEEEGDDA